MRKENPVRYSSAMGEVWIMMTFKVKYCHPIFDFEEMRLYTGKLFEEAFEKYGIRWRKKSFDSNHVHTLLDLGIMSKPEIAKKVKGYTARKLFQKFPWLKRQYFWDSGLWNPATDGRTSDVFFYERYLDKQKYELVNQVKLTALLLIKHRFYCKLLMHIQSCIQGQCLHACFTSFALTLVKALAEAPSRRS